MDLEGQTRGTRYRQSVRLWIRCLAGVVLGSLGLAARADACSKVALVLHQIDANLATTDDTPPTAPTDVTAEVLRRVGRECADGQCTESTCGDTAQVVVQFTLSTDDQSGPAAIGYQVVAAEGQLLPDALKIGATRALDSDVEGSGLLRLEIAFDAAETLDTTGQLIAIDAAGNPSDSSSPFAIKFDGCTHKVTSDECVETEDQALGCSVSASHSPSSAATWLSSSVLLLGAALYTRRAKQRL